MKAALFGCCPRCGARTLFAGPAEFAFSCESCGLDLAPLEPGRGSALFLTVLMGGALATLAVLIDMTLAPPFFLQLLLWLPLTFVLVLGGLRLAKALLVASAYREQTSDVPSKLGRGPAE